MTAASSEIVLNARDWLLPAAIFGGVALLLLVFGYGRGRLSGWKRVVAGVLKAIAIALLLLCLLEPMLTGKQPKEGANLFAIIADDSGGLGIRERPDAPTRGERLRDALIDSKTGDDVSWRKRIGDVFQVRDFTFAERLQPTKGFHSLEFQGGASRAVSAVGGVARMHQGRPLAGMLLLTDGIATDASSLDKLSDDLPPIYPVVVGDKAELPDVGVTGVAVSQTPFEDAPITLEIDLEAIGLDGQATPVRVTEIDGPLNEVQNPEIINGRGSARFRVRPDASGIRFFKIEANPQIGSASEITEGDAKPAIEAEATLRNNNYLVAVDRSGGPYRVLYVAGRPNWDYKFLRRALEDDPELEMSGIIRIARREPKFEWRGRSGENSNPLFRGFDKEDEDQRYDQPVLVRLQVEDGSELASGFPKVPEDLFPKFHAVILDDIEASFFTQDQMELIRDFVSRRGGGFAMLGGTESFSGGNYLRTPIADLLPVYPSASMGGRTAFSVHLTREGWLEPWVRLRDKESDERDRLADMEYFRSVNSLGSIKPAATVLAAVQTEDLDFIDQDAGQARPALVAQRYGDGHAAALAVGDMWRWGMVNKESREDMEKAWRQMIRWLVAEAKGRVRCSLPETTPALGEPIEIRIDALDKSFKPLADALVKIEVDTLGHGESSRSPVDEANVDQQDGTQSSGENLSVSDQPTAVISTVTIDAQPDLDEPGTFLATFVPRSAGCYRVRVAATDTDGESIGDAEAGWTVNPGAEEFRSLEVDRDFLEALAAKTGGRVLELDGLDKFVNDLEGLDAPIMQTWSRPLWHTPWVLLAVVLCLVLEWWLRRVGGMR